MAVPSLRIPTAFSVGLRNLLELSEEQTNALFAAIEGLSLSSSFENIVAQISASIKLELPKLNQTVSLLVSLSGVIANMKASPGEIVTALSDASRELSALKPFGEEQIQGLFKRILAVKSAVLADYALVREIRMSNSATLFKSTIQLEVRPAIRRETQAFVGMVPVFNMALEYTVSGDSKTMYFVLDSDDLRQLKEAIERAEKEMSVFRDALGGGHVNLLD